MKKILGTICVVASGVIAAATLFAAAVSSPVEIYEKSTGRCKHQIEYPMLGFGGEKKVECGTYGPLEVQRIVYTSYYK